MLTTVEAISAQKAIAKVKSFNPGTYFGCMPEKRYIKLLDKQGEGWLDYKTILEHSYPKSTYDL